MDHAKQYGTFTNGNFVRGSTIVLLDYTRRACGAEGTALCEHLEESKWTTSGFSKAAFFDTACPCGTRGVEKCSFWKLIFPCEFTKIYDLMWFFNTMSKMEFLKIRISVVKFENCMIWCNFPKITHFFRVCEQGMRFSKMDDLWIESSRPWHFFDLPNLSWGFSAAQSSFIFLQKY